MSLTQTGSLTGISKALKDQLATSGALTGISKALNDQLATSGALTGISKALNDQLATSGALTGISKALNDQLATSGAFSGISKALNDQLATSGAFSGISKALNDQLATSGALGGLAEAADGRFLSAALGRQLAGMAANFAPEGFGSALMLSEVEALPVRARESLRVGVADLAQVVVPEAAELQRQMARGVAELAMDAGQLDSPEAFADRVFGTAPALALRLLAFASREDVVAYLNVLTALMQLISVLWGLGQHGSGDTTVNNITFNDNSTEVNNTTVIQLPPETGAPPRGVR
ncbi:hypothetical protein MJO55_13515 [Mycolicibacterium rufum]|uniref:X-X-X-Leu-X-X-Gly heptad repeat-containing protein n=2 Tax=Mycolicibacterium rufum TaxID=318424 RepID=A0ABY3UKY8_9MYCO|nr:hypothetical protein [Mycolicibacterium rufum]ULP39325.1 hypothetical protein MJO55_13515 [Mycolicibacterium rufum]